MDPQSSSLVDGIHTEPGRSLLESASEGVLGLDARGVCVFANRAALKILGSTGDSIVGQPVHAIVHGAASDHSAAACPVTAAVIAGEAEAGTDRFRRPAGEPATVEYLVTPATDDGCVRGGILHFKDVTQRNRTRKDVSYYTQLLEAVGQAVIAVDVYGNVTYWNAHAEELFGVTASEASGQPVLALIRSEEFHRDVQSIVEQLLRGNPWSGEMTIERSEASFPIGATVSPIYDEYRSIVGFVGVAENISQRKESESLIREMNERMTQTLERITDGCFSLDRQWRFVYINEPGERALGRRGLAGTNIRDEFPYEAAQPFYEAYESALESQTPRSAQGYYAPSDRWYEARAYPSPGGLTVYFRDITQQRLVEQELIASNERFEAVTRATQDLIFDVDLTKGQVWRSSAMEAHFGYLSSDQEQTMEWGLACVHPSDRARVRTSIDDSLASTEAFWTAGYRLRKADGTYAHVRARANIIRDASGRAVRLIGAVSDISEQKAAELLIQQSGRKMQALSRRLLLVQEAERTRIAREIHDQLGQQLTALKFAARAIGRDGSNLPERTREMGELLDETIETVRRIARELRPPILDNLGVSAAIEREIAEFQKRTGIECSMAVSPTLPEIDPQRAVSMFRIVQEALTNIARYSNARRVNVHLYETTRSLCLRIHDDGCGIAKSQLHSRSSLGLLGMKERAHLVKGTLNVESHRQRGTVVELTIPRHRRVRETR